MVQYVCNDINIYIEFLIERWPVVITVAVGVKQAHGSRRNHDARSKYSHQPDSQEQNHKYSEEETKLATRVNGTWEGEEERGAQNTMGSPPAV